MAWTIWTRTSSASGKPLAVVMIFFVCKQTTAYELVDCVVLFDQDTPLELIERLRPDVLVKGGDYSEDTIVGAPQVRSWGGSVIVVPLTPGQSTTNIIRALRGEH